MLNLLYNKGMIDVEALKANIARNLTEYRKSAGFTQVELAERLNYTDKAVSKWERGESIPDVFVLKEIAELYDVSLDDITAERFHPKLSASIKKVTKHRMFIPLLSAGLVWLIATITFAFLLMFYVPHAWLAFMFATPVSLIVLLVFNSIWGNEIFSSIIVSVLSWACLVCVVVPLYMFAPNINNPWLILLIGIPFQLLVAFWYMMRIRRK